MFNVHWLGVVDVVLEIIRVETVKWPVKFCVMSSVTPIGWYFAVVEFE